MKRQSVTGLFGAVALLLVLANSGRLGAQGISGFDPEKYAAIPEWQPGDLGSMQAPTPRVDLRYLMHAPDDQGTLRSCIGWAMAYMKTSQETVDQGWLPDSNQRRFSPSYIWCQLNGGENRGTEFEPAFAILSRQGCCTLEKMPYSTSLEQVRAPIPSLAKSQARQFRIASYERLGSLARVKQALAQGHVVVAGVHVDPHFVRGGFNKWTPERRRAGAAQARLEGFKHPQRHAVLFVGYDDSRQAALLFNSWGSTWNGDGCAWIDYRLMYRIPNAPASGDSFFLEQAYLVRDVRYKAGAPPQPVPRVAADMRVFSRLIEERGQPVWSLYASLLGPVETIKSLSKVTWTFPGADGGAKTLIKSERDSSFSLNTQVKRPGTYSIKAEILARSGATQTLTRTVSFAAPNPRTAQIKLVQSDRYVGRIDQKPQWEWTARLEGSEEDLGRVDRVAYELHPTFRNPKPVVRTRHNGFALVQTGWGTFHVKAVAHFTDGSSLPLGVQLRFTSPAEDGLKLTNTSRFSHYNDAGDRIWTWSAMVEGPIGRLREIRDVEYHLHPTTFTPANRKGANDPEHGFPISTYGWGVFTLQATVTFKDGNKQRLSHKLRFVPAPAAPGRGDLPPRKGDHQPPPNKGDYPPPPSKSDYPPPPSKGDYPPPPSKG